MKTTLLLLFLNISIGVAATVDVSRDSTNRVARKSLAVTTNDVVMIHAAGGLQAVVQFTEFGEFTASYKWRFLAQGAQGASKPVTGTGKVRGDYEQTEISPGKYSMKAGPKNDTTVKAGDIRIDWFYKNTTSGWLYYAPSLATIEILPAKDFDSKP